jgi:SAM-dependent methyltransferase
MHFRSPLTGNPLHADRPHSLSDGMGERWPVIDGIAYLRVGSEALAARAVERLDDGDETGALALLLAENDRWWTEPPPPPEQLAELVARRDELSLRDAMRLLGWGRVGDYFAHRWSDPTFVAGLALLDAHWTAPRSAFELACGIGHYLRALSQAGVRTIGGDLVFAKLWVARHWVAPDAALVCFDAEARWPIAPRVDVALCNDAFYFLANKAHVAGELSAAAPSLVLAHVHNREHPNLSGGHGMTLDEVRALFPRAIIYADEELSLAVAERRIPVAASLAGTEAFGIAVGGRSCGWGPLSMPPPGASLRRNPLCRDGAPVFPSERYAAEYGGRVTFVCSPDLPDTAIMAPEWAAAARRRDLVDLPERW